MQRKQRKTSVNEQLRKALEDIGGEPLEGSGFESETPEPEFSGSEPDDAAPPRQ